MCRDKYFQKFKIDETKIKKKKIRQRGKKKTAHTSRHGYYSSVFRIKDNFQDKHGCCVEF